MKSTIYTILLTVFCFAATTIQAQKSPKKLAKNLSEQIEESPIFSKSFTGFALLDASTQETLYEYEADKYYTPASNTKLFTLYTALNILDDKMPALYYQEQDSIIVFWGSGDPSLLHPFLPKDNTVLDFLKNTNKPLYFSTHNFESEHYGSGWAWDDFNYYYQPDKSPLPMYSNLVQFIREKRQATQGFRTFPPYFKNKVRLNPNIESKRAKFVRLEGENQFECNAQALTGRGYEKEVPFKYSHELVADLLSEATNKKIQLFDGYLGVDSIQKLYSLPVDSVYQELMQESDNFIAEQLLLLCSNELFGVQNTERMIDYAKENYFKDLPDEPIWRDGSGLSRYNLFTPRSLVKLLLQIHQKIPQERIFNIFAAGGESGTLEDWYAGEDQAYIYAKTGTLSNKHCLSGYLIADSGKVLVFSFMHNNYVTGSKPLKEEMEKVLLWIRENY